MIFREIAQQKLAEDELAQWPAAAHFRQQFQPESGERELILPAAPLVFREIT